MNKTRNKYNETLKAKDEGYQKMVELMNEVQKTTASHAQSLAMMRKLKNAYPEEFWTYLRTVIDVLLFQSSKSVKNKGSNVDRCLEFLALFCTDDCNGEISDDDGSFLDPVILRKSFDYLLMMQRIINDDVRFYSCRFINKILNHLVGYDMSEELYENLQDAMLERAYDSKVMIRQEAVIALCPLQNVTNIDCPVVETYINLIKGDPNPKIRKTCVEKVILRRDIVPLIIARSRDVSLPVRLAAYARALMSPKHFKIEEKQMLLKNSMHDEFAAVKNYAKQQLIPEWFKAYDEDIYEFMKSLRLDSDWHDLDEMVVIIEYVIRNIFSTMPFKDALAIIKRDKNNLIIFEDLNWEVILYWRLLIEYLQEMDDEETTSQYVPALTPFCDYILSYIKYKTLKGPLDETENLEFQFTVKEMFLIIRTHVFGDTECEKALNTLISDILQNYTFDKEVTKVIIDTLELSLPSNDRRIKYICELISDIQYTTELENPTESEDQAFAKAQIKVKLAMVGDEMLRSIEERDFVKAQDLKIVIERLEKELGVLIETEAAEQNEHIEKKSDVDTIMKCLDICTAFLLSPKVRKMDSMLRTLKEELVQELLAHDHIDVQYKAFKCYSLFCLLDKEVAAAGIHVICAPIYVYKFQGMAHEPTLLHAITSVVDLIHLYGADLLATPKDSKEDVSFNEQQEEVFVGGSSLTAIVQVLVGLLNHENSEIQEKAGHGLCTLIVKGRIQSPTVVSRLIIKWANPATDSQKLRQIIGYALEQLPMQVNTSEEIQGAVLPTIKTVVKAPRKSPLADISIDNLVKFMVALCSSCPDGNTIHFNLAITICRELHDHPQKKYNAVFAKMLLLLKLPEDSSAIKELQLMCDEIRDVIAERLVLNNIIKFQRNLTLCTTIPEETEVMPPQQNNSNHSNGSSLTNGTVHETTVQ